MTVGGMGFIPERLLIIIIIIIITNVVRVSLLIQSIIHFLTVFPSKVKVQIASSTC